MEMLKLLNKNIFEKKISRDEFDFVHKRNRPLGFCNTQEQNAE